MIMQVKGVEIVGTGELLNVQHVFKLTHCAN